MDGPSVPVLRIITVMANRTSVATLADGISTRYSDSEAREDIESAELMTGSEQLPKNGMLIHSEYTLLIRGLGNFRS